MKRVYTSSTILFFLLHAFEGISQSLIAEKDWKDTSSLKIEVWATQYYIYNTDVIYQKPGVILKGEGISSLKLSIDTCAFCKAAIEGTMSIIDSAQNRIVLNYGGLNTSPLVDCSKCINNPLLNIDKLNRTLWIPAKGKFGDGVNGYQLVPFKSIAVDPQFIPIGSVIYIPALSNRKFAISGTDSLVHDGYFYSVDIGSAIKENHIDIFTGIFSSAFFPEIITSNKNNTFTAYILTNQRMKNRLEIMHR